MQTQEAQQKEIQISAKAQQINQQLVGLIADKIKQNNRGISFAEYMQLALYAPSLGYYQNGLQKFGAQGDFITAPEMGDLFAYGLVNSIISLDEKLSDHLLEIGAGTGQLAGDILLQLEALGRAPEQYFILEPSANLQALQFETIQSKVPQLIDRVKWLKALPQNFHGVIFANEVLDAIPCERIEKTESGWQQLGVTFKNGQFDWKIIDDIAAEDLPELLQGGAFIEGYISETRPLVDSWINSLSDCLEQGLILLFDYGYPQLEYYHPQRTDGSLRCFTNHQAHSQPLELTGLQDITAHVDFTQVAKAAIESGLEIDGFTSQAGFLLENRILERVEANHSSDNATNYAMSQQVQKLTAPGQMGEVIKVIGLSKKVNSTPSGFTLQDQLYRL